MDFKPIRLASDIVLCPYEHPYRLGLHKDTLIHHKNEPTLAAYRELLAGRKPKAVLEIGIKNGGSLVLWSMLLGCPVVGVDVDLSQVSPNLDRYRIACPDSPIHYFEKSAIWEGLPNFLLDMNLGIDLIIDDGAHIVETMFPSYRILWPILPPGGLYVIEDWAALSPEHRVDLFRDLHWGLVGDPLQVYNISDQASGRMCFYRNFIAIWKGAQREGTDLGSP